jgi:hypothetical protein
MKVGGVKIAFWKQNWSTRQEEKGVMKVMNGRRRSLGV